MKLKDNGKTNLTLHKSGLKMNNLVGWMILLPLVVILYFMIWRSTAIGIGMSFFRMQGYRIKEFCGLDNYLMVIKHTQFIKTLENTVQYVFWSLVIGYLPPIFIAVLLNEVVHFKGFFRTFMYIPTIIPGISAMLMYCDTQKEKKDKQNEKNIKISFRLSFLFVIQALKSVFLLF